MSIYLLRVICNCEVRVSFTYCSLAVLSLVCVRVCLCSSAVEPPIELDEISVLRVHGRGLWVGTRAGFILILDRDKVERGEPPLLGLQKCGEGRVSDICPLLADKQHLACMRVMCSLEHSNETTGLAMVWEYHPHLDGVRLANMRRLPSRQTTASTSSSEGYDVHASRTAKSPDSETTKKAEASADDVIIGRRGDAVPIITEDHNNTTHEIAKNDALTQPLCEAEPHNPFTSSSQIDCTVGSDSIPLVEINTGSSEADSLMKLAANNTEQLPACPDTEPDLAARKDQPLLPMLKAGEASLVTHRSDCSGSSLEDRSVSGGREEESSLGSWEVVPHLPVQPPGGGACTREVEHNIIEEEGEATLSADGSTPTDLAEGEAEGDQTNDPGPCPPYGSTPTDLAEGEAEGDQTNDPEPCPPYGSTQTDLAEGEAEGDQTNDPEPCQPYGSTPTDLAEGEAEGDQTNDPEPCPPYGSTPTDLAEGEAQGDQTNDPEPCPPYGSTPTDLAEGEAQGDQTNEPEPCPPCQEFSEPGDTTVVNEAAAPDMESDSQSDLLDHLSVTM